MWSSHGSPQWKCFSGLQLIARATSLHRGHLRRVSIVSGEGNGTPLQCSCLENPMDGGAWWAAVHGVAKSRTRLSNFTFTFHFHALEKETATHSSVLAWRIPGTGEPGGLPSVVYGVAQSRTRLKRLSNRSSTVSVTASRHPSRIWFTYLRPQRGSWPLLALLKTSPKAYLLPRKSISWERALPWQPVFPLRLFLTQPVWWMLS